MCQKVPTCGKGFNYDLLGFVLLGFYATFNIISVISQQQFTYSWSLGKQTSTRLENVPCPRALHHDRWFEIPDVNHSTTADSLPVRQPVEGLIKSAVIFLTGINLSHLQMHSGSSEADIFRSHYCKRIKCSLWIDYAFVTMISTLFKN